MQIIAAPVKLGSSPWDAAADGRLSMIRSAFEPRTLAGMDCGCGSRWPEYRMDLSGLGVVGAGAGSGAGDVTIQSALDCNDTRNWVIGRNQDVGGSNQGKCMTACAGDPESAYEVDDCFCLPGGCPGRTAPAGPKQLIPGISNTMLLIGGGVLVVVLMMQRN